MTLLKDIFWKEIISRAFCDVEVDWTETKKKELCVLVYIYSNSKNNNDES